MGAMKQQILARTKYCDGYWLKWETGFNDGFRILPVDILDKKELENDIQVILENDKGENLGDAICHYGSYGVENGLWEIMIDTIPDYEDDSVLGYLTFKQVLKYFDKKIKKLSL